MKLKVFIQPSAKKTEVVGFHGDSLKIKIKAPPVDGEANSVLIKFLSESLSINQKDITLVHGKSSRNKLLEIFTEKSTEEILNKLLKNS